MRVVADLHIHSRYSRATSQRMDLPYLAQWAGWKGIDLLGTGDFTHPDWFSQLKLNLVPLGNGIYRYHGALFLLTTEVAAVWRQGGMSRRVHFLVLAPDLAAAGHINQELARLGNLAADGRPTLRTTGEELIAAVLAASPAAAVIPAHVWTPWYAIFGAKSGFDTLEEGLGEGAPWVFALETGLSSDPPMNWRLSALDRLSLVSFSDAHSPARLGREACAFQLPEVSFPALVSAIADRDPGRFLGTIEFFPQEGKYHYDGHRACGVVLSPEEARRLGGRCPVCGRPVTCGVLHRVEELADRPQGFRPPQAIPYCSLVPLEEIIAQALGRGRDTKGVREEYLRLVTHFGSELRILLDLPEEELAWGTPPRILQGIRQVRAGAVTVLPGYDGAYGAVKLSFAEDGRPPHRP
ncbi:MAG: endonuclease Q family protein [Candidatus Bipolaricaulaceae bacterium]